MELSIIDSGDFMENSSGIKRTLAAEFSYVLLRLALFIGGRLTYNMSAVDPSIENK